MPNHNIPHRAKISKAKRYANGMDRILKSKNDILSIHHTEIVTSSEEAQAGLEGIHVGPSKTEYRTSHWFRSVASHFPPDQLFAPPSLSAWASTGFLNVPVQKPFGPGQNGK